jgi:glycosyltransferase involved in cell wall biosynthesis
MARLLMIAAFPPRPGSGWVRVHALTKWLGRKGWEVVLLVPPLDDPPPDVARIVEVGYFDPKRVLRTMRDRGLVPRPASTGHPAGRGLTNRVAGALRSLGTFPGDFSMWIVPASVAGVRLARRFRPEIILSSTPHPTANIVAGIVSRISGTPWVADYRDLWVGNPYVRRGAVRQGVERGVENGVIREARAITTVSEPLADILRARFGSAGRPVHAISNGFDPEEWSNVPLSQTGETLVFLYAGVFYQGARDLSPLLGALARLSDAGVIAPSTVEVHLYGGPPGDILSKADALGLGSIVQYKGRVDRSTVLGHMRKAGVLLLPLDADPSLRPAKVFEYLASRRPILAIGDPANAAARVVAETNTGVVARSPSDVERAVRDWYLEWRRTGRLPVTEPHGTEAYTHERMACRFDDVLRRAAGL